MVRPTMPKAEEQTAIYRRVIDHAGDRPVVFRTLDIGGDKVLPYLGRQVEENPAMGWRAIRLTLDRPALLKVQLRAMLEAAAGRSLHVLFPKIGRASCRERVCQYVWVSVVALSLKKKNNKHSKI